VYEDAKDPSGEDFMVLNLSDMASATDQLFLKPTIQIQKDGNA
jgi:hypothetical protein